MKRLLLQIESCPYCKKAREALDAQHIQYDIIEIDPSDRTLVKTLSGQESVPILVKVWGEVDQDDDIVENISEIARK